MVYPDMPGRCRKAGATPAQPTTNHLKLRRYVACSNREASSKIREERLLDSKQCSRLCCGASALALVLSMAACGGNVAAPTSTSGASSAATAAVVSGSWKLQ